MSKRGRTFTMSDDIHALTPTLHPPRSETGMSTFVLMLTNTNYCLWAMRMDVSLEAHDLWGVIDGSEVNRKKDHFALSMILNSIFESQRNQIDIKKSAKENWEVLRTFHAGMDKVVQAKVQALKREFEKISMKRNEKIDDYSNWFSQIVTNLRDLGESLDEYGAVSRLLRSVPKDFDSLILLLEQTSDLKTMILEEAFGKLKVHERSKHSYLGHFICLRRIKRGHLQAEGDEERKEKANIVVMILMERRKRSNLTNPR